MFVSRSQPILGKGGIAPWRQEGVPAVLVLALVVQVVAGFALRGLYADGAYFVTQIIGHQSFIFTVPARRTATFLAQFPAVTAVTLGIVTPQRIAMIFSITTNVLPGFLLLLCRIALPTVESRLFVLPVFVYFAGTLSA
jgi:hypothetical protein